MWSFSIIGIAGALALFWARSEYEKHHFVVEEAVISSSKLRSGRTFVFLSDLHNKEFGEGNRELLSAIEKVRPEAVLIGGDMMVCRGARDMDAALRLVKALADQYPVYYGNGNHEQRMKRKTEVYGDQYQQFVKQLNKHGVHYLPGRSQKIGEDIRISGLDLKREYYRKCAKSTMPVEEITRQLGKTEESVFQILLAHSPLFFKTYVNWGADLTLSGHFHGGTIRLPFLGGVMTPQFHFFLPWCAGDFCEQGKRMIVSRGLGTHSINIRINNKPQLLVLRLMPESDRE